MVPLAQSGQLTMLAVTSARRSALLPDVPTLRENGVDGVEADAWDGLIAPARTPPEIIERLRATAVAVLAEPAIHDKLALQYMEPVGDTPDEFRATIQQELNRWTPVIEKNNIHIQLVDNRVILVVIFDSESSLGLVRLRVRRATDELKRVFDAVQKKALQPGHDSPFAEITDDDIDNLFND